jgi:hypothetical protein
VKRHRPDPDQALFRFTWHDEADDRPDAPEDDDPADFGAIAPHRQNGAIAVQSPAPLRDRVLRLYAPAVMRELWGTAVIVRNAPRKPVARSTRPGPTVGTPLPTSPHSETETTGTLSGNMYSC